MKNMQQSKYLFLDDLRFPKEVTWVELPHVEWEIVRSYAEAVTWVQTNGWPVFVSFDHDLGDVESTLEKTGYDFAHWLIEDDLTNYSMPIDFDFAVHSMNHIGKKRIEALFENYKNRR